MTTKALPSRHPRRERLDAEDDAVDVDREDPPVVVDRAVALREHAGVQADEVRRFDAEPRLWIGDVEPVGEIEPSHLASPRTRAARTSARPIPPAEPVTTAVSGNKNDLAGRARDAISSCASLRLCERVLGSDDGPDRAAPPERDQLACLNLNEPGSKRISRPR